MKKIIHKKMCVLSIGIVLILGFFAFWMLATMLDEQINSQMEIEGKYIADAVNYMENSTVLYDYLSKVSKETKSRVTLIDNGGTVTFDSEDDPLAMENHIDRPEVVDAINNGSGKTVRASSTIGGLTYYYAILLDDGNIVRIAYTSSDIFKISIKLIITLIFVLSCVIIVSIIMAEKMTKEIVKPINSIDFQNMPDKFVYSELDTLFERISIQNKERNKNEQMRKEFSANVSHELKTPLTSISGYAEIISNGLANKEDIPVFADKIHKEAARLINLIEDIIRLSKLDEKKPGIEKEKINIYEIANNLKEILDNTAAKFSVTYSILGEDVYINGVSIMIHELLINLSENAMKYNKKGGNVEIKITKDDANAIISVKDTGIGIPEEYQSRIFERFYRVDKSHSKQTGGTGLGLAIVKHVVEFHEGEIQISSKEGVGTEIITKIPLYLVEQI